MSPSVMFAQPLAQSLVKLSMLIKETRQLGYETFSGSDDAMIAKNWLKKVYDTVTDMELEDDHKLRVATRLIDKNVAIQWDNLKL